MYVGNVKITFGKKGRSKHVLRWHFGVEILFKPEFMVEFNFMRYHLRFWKNLVTSSGSLDSLQENRLTLRRAKPNNMRNSRFIFSIPSLLALSVKQAEQLHLCRVSTVTGAQTGPVPRNLLLERLLVDVYVTRRTHVVLANLVGPVRLAVDGGGFLHPCSCLCQ